MSKELIVSATTLETKVAILEEDQVTEIFVERAKNRGILGNIYKGKVTKVLPGMQSAFVDIGLERDAFLYVSDFVEDYEEYEKMFNDAEQAAEKLLRVENKEDHIQPDEPRRRPPRGRGRQGRRGRPDRPDRPDRVERPDRMERSGRPERFERSERPAVEARPPDRESGIGLAGPEAESASAEPAPFESQEARSEKRAVETPFAIPEPAPVRTSSSWLDEVRQAQAALEREAKETSPSSSGSDIAESREDRQAGVRHRRDVDEFSLPDDEGGDAESNDRFRRESSVKTDAEPESIVPSAVKAPQDFVEQSTWVEPADQPGRFGSRETEEEAGSDQAGTVPPAVEMPGEETVPGQIELPAGSPGEGKDRRRRRQRPSPRRRVRGKNQGHHSIGDLLREGQEIVVQVAKEPIAKKGARITSHIALPGRFIVYMPTVDHVGVSRKIVSDKTRARLKEIVLRLRGDSKRGFIVRTAGENAEEKDIRADMMYLTRLWDEIRQKAERKSAPAVIHSELDLVPRLLRDYVSGDFKAIRVDDEAEYERIVEFIHKLDPSLVSRVKLYTKATQIFDEYGINAEIEKALKQKVWLKSGGYIVINQTEALVAIDVNTGKFVGRGDSLEDTITRTNLDAVKEVVRQIRLRDLGGIIVIDFIDMDERRNRQKVMDALERELAHDKSPTKILQFNEFGLVAITRKRVKQSLERTLCQPCPYCNGVGMVKSLRTVCYTIHAEVKKLLPAMGDGEELMLRVNPEVARALREKEHVVLDEIHEMTGKDVSVKADPLVHFEQFDIVEM
ncbi:MAG TPA: Rne/Rng family ribonuclease [Acidobacteriota bacterium]|jgi:ribonuclease G